MILVIDNYDSFTYTLVQYLGELEQEPVVFRNDAITLGEIENMAPSGSANWLFWKRIPLSFT